MSWRASQLFKKYHFDVRRYFKKIYSTFDYKNTNIKTREMLTNIIERNYKQGYREFVYADDKKKNCIFFIDALNDLFTRGYQLTARVYNLKSGSDTVKAVTGQFIKVGSLLKLLKYEQILRLDSKKRKA